MSELFRLNGSVKHDPAIAAWFERDDELRRIARRWFDEMRRRGADVREVMHDGCPTACVGDAAFAYVDAFKGHVNVGFFNGAALADPAGLLQGTGKRMRHVKLRPDRDVDGGALKRLIAASYAEIRLRVAAGDLPLRAPSRKRLK